MTAILPLTIKNAVVRRRGKVLVGPIDFQLAGTGITIVIGPNGAGKTSLLRMMHGLDRLNEGTVQWAVSLDDARGRQAFVFQTPRMMRRDVRDSIAFPLTLTGMSKRTARAQAEVWADRVGLADMLGLQASVLSGGERQKLALARALIRKPDVLFLDEPCASLDGRSTREIEEILARAVSDGTRLVMSTHDMGQARRLAGEVVFLFGGKICEYQPAPEFFKTPHTTQARAFVRGDIVE